MTQSICRWGILGTAFIARKNWQGIRLAGNASLVAVASRSLNRAQQFIDECQADAPFHPPPRPMGSYEELLASPDIDAVYMPLPTGVRKAWAVRAAEAGKHLVVEKPVGVNVAEVQEIITACDRNNVQFMDGVMFMHSQRLTKLRDALNDRQAFGRLRRMVTQFSFGADNDFLRSNIRGQSGLEPLGCLGDLGWYSIRFILWAMSFRLPTKVAGRTLQALSSSNGPSAVPTEFSGELFFDDDVSASFYCSFLAEHQQWCHLSGSHGSIHIPDFVIPVFGAEAAFTISNPVFHIRGPNFNMEDHTRRIAVHEYSNSEVNSQETNLFRKASELARSGQRESYWSDIALKTQRVLDACLASSRTDGAAIACEDQDS